MTSLRTCEQLLEEFPFRKLRFSNTKLPILLGKNDDRDVYNISAPFFHNSSQLLLGRVEPRNSEDASVMFFQWRGGVWVPDERYRPIEHLQDPFYCKIDGKLVIGGVKIEQSEGEIRTYRTVFYRENRPFQMERFFSGPEQMKDIRLLELPDGRILITTRPQGACGGRGIIGFFVIPSLEKLDRHSLQSAYVFQDQFSSEEWGGTNELHLLRNGKVGVLSHIARYDDCGNRHYYATCFLLDPFSGRHSPMKMLAVRNNFEDGPSKRDDLKDVVFSGGLVRQNNGTARLYCGVGDAEAHCITILDPFSEWESSCIS